MPTVFNVLAHVLCWKDTEHVSMSDQSGHWTWFCRSADSAPSEQPNSAPPSHEMHHTTNHKLEVTCKLEKKPKDQQLPA